jgi:hypothetical protein
MQGWHTTYLGMRELPREIGTSEMQAFFTYLHRIYVGFLVPLLPKPPISCVLLPLVLQRQHIEAALWKAQAF